MDIHFIKKYWDFFKKTEKESIIILQGSRRSGKTYAILQYLGLKFQQEKNKTIQVFSERPEQREAGLFKDFNDIWAGFFYNKTSSRIPLINKATKSTIKFINIPQNVASFDFAKNISAADYRFVNEANVYKKETFENLLISNKEKMIVDYNPITDFWIDEYINDHNFIKTTWKDNSFLTKSQINEFKRWVKLGKASEEGSYNYWRWQVLCEGNYAQILGDIFTTENIAFTNDKDNLHTYIIFADPSNAKGGDNFALILAGINALGQMVVVDSFSSNKTDKKIIAEIIRQWQKDYNITDTYIETNGEIGLKFYNDCLNSNIPVNGWYSRNNKFERIMSNYDIITNLVLFYDNENNRNYVKQIYQFKQDAEKLNIKDDNIDCVNNAIIAYRNIFGYLLRIF